VVLVVFIVVVVDKTGTLTEGRPEVTRINTYGDWTEDDILRIAGALELQSEHPLARAIVRRAESSDVPLDTATEFDSITGGGVVGTVNSHHVVIGNAKCLDKQSMPISDDAQRVAHEIQSEGATVVFVGIDGQLAAIVTIADPIKERTPAALKRLHELGLRVVMLTGDARATAQAVAKQLGIDEVHAGISPEEKHEYVKRLKDDGRIVAMAGDGINDAPALAEANVGIAMGTGTGVAIESAGVTLVGGDLRGVAAAILLSRKTMSNIRQNLFFAFVYNSLGIPLAAGALYPFFGVLLSPMIAAAAMSFSSVSVIANALRLRTVRLV
jgi:Cu+-exporting ATPase